ncbi:MULTISPECIES: MFS transporter [Paraburkholderia]|uniref:MFS transporter n=1 Tax=Paraburkholderia dipogonis TaxID=1211383 RepID=A0A4Y8MH02_9BURK|nr:MULTISPECIES: MFS transporter [Paraburkholderia]RKR31351.1 putative MFS family arabinose efflux permease [Paraburkholderia sp. BL17N1]TFE36685.1 MFS transporter [Paraburkholderia dipogonis]
MNRSIDGLKGRTSLVLGHCAGMIDVVALPVWVGIVLIRYYGLDPQSAGALATSFLGAAVVSSLFISSRIDRIRGRIAAPAGFALAAVAFFCMALTRDYTVLVGLHVVGGLAVGCALSLTHSAIGASPNPHRLIATGFTALSILSLGFLGGVPRVVSALGGQVVFLVLGAIMLTAALFGLLGFPDRPTLASRDGMPRERERLSQGVWFAMVGTGLLTLSHSMMLSFLEPIGLARGFSVGQVMNVLLVMGVVNMLPGLLAALLERKVSSRAVMVAGPLLQGALGFTLTRSTHFAPYAVAGVIFPTVIIFTHTFVFAFLARNDPSTRAVAATPVMAMTGSAIGPILGGAVARHFGYESIGWAILVAATISVVCFWQAGRRTQSVLVPAAEAAH